MDLYQELIACLKKELEQHDPAYTVPEIPQKDVDARWEVFKKWGNTKEWCKHRSQAREMLSTYFNALWRKIEPIPRRVEISQELQRKRGTLALDKDLTKAVEQIQDELTIGADVNAHLSKLTQRLDKFDMLLNQWHIFHFHLGLTMDSKSKFYKRTGSLLLAYFPLDEAAAYFLDVIPAHRKEQNPDAFSDQTYLKIIKRNWPNLLNDSVIGLGGSWISNKSMREDAWDKHKNTVALAEDRFTLPMAGGVTTQGGSAYVELQANRLLGKVLDWEKQDYGIEPEKFLGEGKTLPAGFRIDGRVLLLVEKSNGKVLDFYKMI